MGEIEKSPKGRRPATRRKDIWDKIGALTVPFVTLVIGLLGAYATYTYNRASLNQQAYQTNADRLQRAADANADRLQRNQQARDSVRLAQAQQLQGMFAYVSSSDPQRREFGYTMFAAMGQADLAIRLISLKQDRAGIRVLNRLATDPNAAVRLAATESLASVLSGRQLQAIDSAMRANYTISNYGVTGQLNGDVTYGIGGWGISGGDLDRLLRRYCTNDAARVRELCADARLQLPITSSQIALLTSASSDPAMRRTQTLELTDMLSAVAQRGDSLARELGLRLPLSLAFVRDTIARTSPQRARRWAQETGTRSPAQGGDEQRWTRAFLARQRRSGRLADQLNYYQRLIDAGDWQLRSIPAVRPPRTSFPIEEGQ